MPAQEDQFIGEQLARLSLEQKIGQMTMAERGHVTPDEVKAFAIGSVLAGGGSHPGENRLEDWVALNDAYWQAAVGDTDSFGIPILFGIDAVHGHGNVLGATVFPHNIGLGAAGSPELVGRIARITAREILTSGLDWNFAPTMAVVQNPQWGRTFESFGQNSARNGALGEAYVRALQDEGVMACTKHWVGDGATLHGVDQGEARLSWEELEGIHIAPYYPSLKAGVMSVMVSFNSWNGQKCHGHEFLLSTLLKGRLGFEGIVVSDWNGINYLDEDFDQAVLQSVNAGIDLFMVPDKWRTFIDSLLRLVADDKVDTSRIDDAVTRIVRGKYRLGLFESPRPRERPRIHDQTFGCAEHRQVARDAVRKSLVLLKAEGDILPLETHQRILVAGRNADNLGHQCGGWTVSWQGEENGERIAGTSIWQGIRTMAPNAVLSADRSGAEANPALHDLAVVVIGERPYAEGFGDIRTGDDVLVEVRSMVNGIMNPLEPYGHTLELAALHPEDLVCIRRIASAGVPIVTVLVSGRPLIVNEEMQASHAFIAAWLPGSEGAGIADMLFGQSDFTGRLPLPWPSRMTNGKTDSSFETLFPTGHGLRVLGRTKKISRINSQTPACTSRARRAAWLEGK